MFYKYCSKKNSFLFFLLAFTKASESVFIAFIVSLYINLAQTQNYHGLFFVSVLSMGGILLFTLLNFGYQKVRATLLRLNNLHFFYPHQIVSVSLVASSTALFFLCCCLHRLFHII